MSQHKARLKDKKFCRDKEISYRNIFQELQGMTSWLQQSFYVVTITSQLQQNYVVTLSNVATITSLLQQNYVTTLSNYVTTESKKKVQNHVVIEIAGHDKSWGTKMKTMSRQNFPCRDKVTNWSIEFLGIHNFSLEVQSIT